MSSDRFSRCLAVTLKWEGGYSNHPDDPGGPTMRGVIQREYDVWRARHRQSKRPVRDITNEELHAIYRENYWNAADCEALGIGLDLCVFDAAVNSGVLRAKAWLGRAQDIDGYCALRLEFLQRTGRLWRVFGRGWRVRVAGIRGEAHRMTATGNATSDVHDETLHAGMRNAAVGRLQKRLRALGYPCGLVDGIYGEQTYRAVVLFQTDNALDGEPGVWLADYDAVLKTAPSMLPKRRAATHRDLEAKGDKPILRMNLIQRFLAWIFGASAVAQVWDGSGLVESLTATQSMLEPVRGLIEWASGHKWLMMALVCASLIALVRALRNNHVRAFQNFDYQGQQAPDPEPQPLPQAQTLAEGR